MNGRMKELALTVMMIVMVLSVFGALIALPAGATEPPQLITYTITNTTITPPQTTSIDVRFSERVEAWIKIEDSDRNQVNELYHSSGVTNPTPKTWNGTYTNDTVVPDGDYYVNVTGLNTTTELSVVNNTERITVTSGAEPITVTRSYVKGTEPGTAVVTVSYTVNTAISALTIKENIPSDWTITEQTSSPAASEYKEPTQEWLYAALPGVGGSGTITYTVSGPAGDTDTISGGYNIGAGYVDTPSTSVTLTGANEIVITFVEPPTPANGETVSVNNVNITVSIAQTDISTVLLNWNGVNETMNAIGVNSWSYTKTGLINGTYTYEVYANDTLDNWGVSETRTVTIPELLGVTITGTVKGINQETISDATVTIDGHPDTTDADGKYSVINVPSGTYTITATATGYRSEAKADVDITTDATIDFVDNDGLLKEPCSDTTYVLQVINKWAADEITDTTKVLTQINIWAAS